MNKTRVLLILRPEPGASTTAERAAAMGMAVAILPLFETRALAWSVDDTSQYDAILLTSANAVRFCGAGLVNYLQVPVYAVGKATAEAARQAGFVTVTAGEGDVAALIAHMGGCGAVLHLAGRDRTATGEAPFRIDTIPVYASEPLTAPDIPKDAVALLHSTRAAVRLAAITSNKASVAIVAISRAVADAAGPGWQSVAVADRPLDAAMLALAASLCKMGTD